ncbi:unnamed protein product [Schistosoma rodhaini]|uniref:Uncharacterized protein n=1 Tax=Schistosoma rodhaini TaxID=6188 RepID=A0AA85EYT9_9TREM|nr:unnamed protein product [Schistosoma rodhaini]
MKSLPGPYGFIPYPVSFVPIIGFYSPVYKDYPRRRQYRPEGRRSHVYSPNSDLVNTKGAHPPIHQTLNKIYLQIFPYEKAYEKRKMYE